MYIGIGGDSMKTIVIIQARMGSSRLPGKILTSLGKHDVLKYVVERCRKIEGITDVVVATSVLPQDDVVEQWCIANEISYYRGSEEDVLDRYVQCAKEYHPDYIMRVTADCPFVDYEMASELVKQIERHPVDIIDVQGELPRGLAVELISYEALCRIHKVGTESRHREHVTYYAYEFRDQFQRCTYEAPSNRCYPELRITLDTEEDYQLMIEIDDHFQDVYVSSQRVIQFLLENQEIAQLNKYIQQKPVI